MFSFFKNRKKQRNSTDKGNIDYLYETLWRDGLSQISSETNTKLIATDFLIPNEIDPIAFAYNYEVFLQNGRRSFEATFFPNQTRISYTASITEAANPLRYIPAFPEWFIAACPDVFLWFSNFQRDKIKNRGKNDDINDVMTNLIIELFRFTSEDINLQISDVKDTEEKWLPKWLNNLAASYKQKTGKHLETSLAETKNNSIMEIYKNTELARSMSEAGIDTFTLIARKTTMYYLELVNNYRERFTSETCLLAAAGVFDAQVYIFVYKNIEIAEVIEIAKNAIAHNGDSLLEFIIELETKILTADSPELSPRVVENCCQEERVHIQQEVRRVQKEYKRDSFIAQEARVFMESPDFGEMRNQLGIE